jgi:hypothetical protein
MAPCYGAGHSSLKSYESELASDQADLKASFRLVDVFVCSTGLLFSSAVGPSRRDVCPLLSSDDPTQSLTSRLLKVVDLKDDGLTHRSAA